MNPHPTSCVALALALIVGGCATEEMPSKGSLAGSGVTLTFQRIVNLNGYQAAELTLSNRSPLPVWYTGNTAENPVYDIQYSSGNTWEDSGDKWCVMGLESFQLASQQSVTFTAFVSFDERAARGVRVGVLCSPQEDYKAGVGRMYWSEKFTAPK